MKIESEVILDWLQAEKKLLAKKLDKACKSAEVVMLLGNLEEVNKAIIALKEYTGEIDE